MDLSIIIVSWNTRELLHDCLASLSTGAGELRAEIIVGDNGSTDGSVEMVRRDFPSVHLVQNSENLGFARANNRLFAHCQAELILLLNSDTVVAPGALEILVRFLAEHPDAGAVGPKLIHPRLELSVLGCGAQPTLRSVFNHYFFLSRLFPRFRAFDGIHHFIGLHDREPRTVGWLSGACLMVRRSVIDAAGPLTEQWFMYSEDQEWCARIAAVGWKLYHVPAAVVAHHLGASTDQNEAASVMPATSSREHFIMANRPSPLALFFYDCIRTTGLAVRAIAYRVLSFAKRGSQRASWNARGRMFARYASAAAPWNQRSQATFRQRTVHAAASADPISRARS